MKRSLALAAALASAAAACTTDTSVPTTPTFSAARYLPEAPPDRGPGQAPQAPVAGPAPEPRPETVRGLTGVKAVSAANRGSTVDPDDASMRGATWYVEDAQSWMIYRVCTAAGHVTTVLLPPGERFNGAVGGDVEGFLINVAYAGPRPAVSILPRTPGARSNLQLVTTEGFYSFKLAPCRRRSTWSTSRAGTRPPPRPRPCRSPRATSRA